MRAILSLAVVVLWAWTASALEPAQRIVSLIHDEPLSPPVKHALADLKRALAGKNLRLTGTPGKEDAASIVLGTAKQSKAIGDLLGKNPLPHADESLCIRNLPGSAKRVLVAGRDERGLSYALRDVAREIELAPAGDPLSAIADANEEPLLRIRSVTLHLFNEDLEKDWYFDEAFWRDYFHMLVGCRFNQLTLTFGDQTNYLNPIYAYLLDVPGFPNVRVQGLTPEAKRRNLAMLKRITELSSEYGVDFNLGIWMQMPEPRYAGKILVEGLPEGMEAAKYCGEGLRLILQACPGIKAVQLRMNDEAGVPEAQQTEFFRPIFRALRDCGRHLRVELRYKGLRPATLQAAIDMGLDVIVSTKFWCEHMGLPFHPTEEDAHYRESRYGYGAMLFYPRPYKVMYRLWTAGTQRLLLWGDPDYAAKYARSCRLGDGEGMEVFAPLTNRGYGNAPGNWPLFADAAYQHHKWDHDRYWYYYLAFGRMAYNPEMNAEVWRREFRHRFGGDAETIANAYRHASQVLPLITATRLPSASEWSWWPEMDTGDALPEYMRTQPSDRGQFYAIRTWQRTPHWRCEAWDEFVPGYVEDTTAGRLRAKWTPIMVSRRLNELSANTLKCLEQGKPAASSERRATELDLRITAALARFHAEKTLAATQLGFFEITREGGRVPVALKHMKHAAEAWQTIVRLTDGVYTDGLVFGTSPENARNKFGHHHSGHWKDRLKQVEADLAYVEKLVAQHGSDDRYRRLPGEEPLTDAPHIEHVPVTLIKPSDNLTVNVGVKSAQPVKKVILHFRPVNQMSDWKEYEMRPAGEGRYETAVSSREITARWDYMYYVEALVEGGGALWPSWEEGQPYVVVRVVR